MRPLTSSLDSVEIVRPLTNTGPTRGADLYRLQSMHQHADRSAGYTSLQARTSPALLLVKAQFCTATEVLVPKMAPPKRLAELLMNPVCSIVSIAPASAYMAPPVGSHDLSQLALLPSRSSTATGQVLCGLWESRHVLVLHLKANPHMG